jgi:hypothetical protein
LRIRISGPKAAAILALAASVAGLAWFYERYRLRELPPAPFQSLRMDVENGAIVVRFPGRRLVGELGRYDDELFAYLMHEYLRSRPALAHTEILLTYSVRAGRITYALKAVLPDDLILGIARLYSIAGDFPFVTPGWAVADDRVFSSLQGQNESFRSAYNFPTYKKLDQLSQADVVAYTRRFIRFKSSTDPRIRRQIEPIPRALTPDEADQLANDIVQVAQFYALPLEFFLGIGAMENNYMNVKGDLGNAIWKKHAAKDDVVLRRRPGRVLVLNESSGVWQITRETLRFVHRLYLLDRRDYSELAEHLRPPKELDVMGLDHRVLTTYAGLLFRDLLDHFKGDMAKAVGAYNGGPGNPNARYEAGVRMVAEYARRIMEQAAVLRGQRVAGLVLLRPAASSRK